MERNWVLGIASCFVLVLCHSAATFAQSSPPSVSLPPVINVGTHSMGSKVYAVGAGMAKVWSSHLKTEVKVSPLSGPIEWTPMLATKEIDLGLLSCGDAWMAWLSKEEYATALDKKMAPLRLLTAGSPNYNAIVVAANSGIVNGRDLKGKKVVCNYSGSGIQKIQAEAALANFNLSPKDLIALTVPSVAFGIKAVSEGKADANAATVLGMGVLSELDATKGARLLSFDPSREAIERYKAIQPFGEMIRVEPGPGKVGVREPINMFTYDLYLVARTNLDDPVAYELVKALWDNNKELAAIHASLKEWTTDKFLTKEPLIPFHPGAIRFYKEKGLWDSEMDKKQADLIKKER